MAAPAHDIAEKFADLSVLQSRLDSLPEEQRGKLGAATFEKDAIIITNPQVGQVRFEVVERTPQAIVMQAQGLLPMQMRVDMQPDTNPDSTIVTTAIDIDLPLMLRPFVGPHMQKAADQFGSLIEQIATGNGL